MGHRSIFGHVTDHWQRIEFQNRGAVHIHMLLWVDNSESKEGKVSAVPREVDDVNLREMRFNCQVKSG